MADISVELKPAVRVPSGSQKGLTPWKPGQSGNPHGRPKKKLLSDAYSVHLNARVPREIAKALGCPENWSWADAIANQVLKKAVGQVSDKDINFTAITELRESTEGKTPERVAIGQGNEELTALARAISDGPIDNDIPDAEFEDVVPETPSEPEAEYETPVDVPIDSDIADVPGIEERQNDGN
jgi:hypothetical protein